MEKCENKSHSSWSLFRKAIPTLILLALAVAAGGTDVFSRQVHEVVGHEFKQRLTDLAPYMFNVLFAAIWINIGWLLYHKCCCGFDRLIHGAKIDEAAEKLGSKVFRLAYWVLVLLVAVAFFAPGLLAWMAGAATVVTAALSFNVGGLLNDYVAGLFLQRWLKDGEPCKVNEIAIAVGKVVSIGNLRTSIESEVDGPMTVRNSKLWDCTLAKPKKNLIILPSDPPKDDSATAAAAKK
jgi:small-conductance mechanosensitive channel